MEKSREKLNLTFRIARKRESRKLSEQGGNYQKVLDHLVLCLEQTAPLRIRRRTVEPLPWFPAELPSRGYPPDFNGVSITVVVAVLVKAVEVD